VVEKVGEVGEGEVEVGGEERDEEVDWVRGWWWRRCWRWLLRSSSGSGSRDIEEEEVPM
jgi:hypothetical protein